MARRPWYIDAVVRVIPWLLSICMIAGCSSEAPALIVDLRTDYRPGVDFGAVRTELVTVRAPVSSTAFATDDFSIGRRVAEFENLEAGAYELRMALLSPSDGTPIAESTERVEVSGPTAATVEMWRFGMDGSVGDGGMDTGSVDPAACLEGQYPQRPGPGSDGDDGMERTYVFVEWQLFPSSPNYGFNLDERCTTDDMTASCVADTIVTDEEQGIDNAFASRIAGSARTYFSTIGEDPEADLGALQGQGIMDLLIRVRGWNGENDDSVVEVDLMQTVCGHTSTETDCTPGMTRPAGLTFDGTDTFYVSEESISIMDPSAARVVQGNAYVRDRILVVPMPLESALRLPVEAGYIDIGLKYARLTAPLPADETGYTIENAVISGRWSLTNFQETIAYFGTCPSDFSPVTDLINGAIMSALDIMEDPTSDNMELPCDAISASIRVTGYQGVYGGAKPQVRLLQACPPPP